jgi:hypothetical protein
MKHPFEHLRFPKAAVEMVAEFRQAAGQMVWADTVGDTTILPLIFAIEVWTRGKTSTASFPEPVTSYS